MRHTRQEVKRLVDQWLDQHPDKALADAAIRDDDANPPSMVEYVAEAMSIYAGSTDTEQFIAPAEAAIKKFTELNGRPPDSYLELEEAGLGRTHAP
jgi:hypothetical protein